MSGESYIKRQWKLRDPSNRPSGYAIDRAECCCADLSLAPAERVQLCFRLAREIDEAFQRGQHTAQETTPPPGPRGVIDRASTINTLIAQAREGHHGSSAVPCSTVEAAQTLFAALSAGEPLLSFCEDLASATKTVPLDVGLAVLADQALTLSAGNYSTVNYSIGGLSGGPVMLSSPTIEVLTGNIPQHTWEGWLPGLRHLAGHTPRQHIRTTEDQAKKDAVRTFLDEQKRQSGWTPEGSWPDGTAPKGFWPAVEQVWQEQYQQQWGAMSQEALRKADERLPQLMPPGANT